MFLAIEEERCVCVWVWVCVCVCEGVRVCVCGGGEDSYFIVCNIMKEQMYNKSDTYTLHCLKGRGKGWEVVLLFL